MNRRAVLAGVPSVFLLGGCTELLTQENAEFEAEYGVVTESARSATNYREANRAEDPVERNYDGVDRTVVAINKLTEYARTVDLPLAGGGQLGRFTVLASPEIPIVPGEPANPLADMGNDELAMRVQAQYETIDNVRSVDERQADLLGETVTVSRYRADAETAGESVEVHLHIAKGESQRSDGGRDFIVTVGVNPSAIDERENVDRLVAGVEHPA